MKKQLLVFVLLSAMLCATQSQDANASKKSAAINTSVKEHVKFNLSILAPPPTLIYLGRLQDPFVSYIQYDLYGSGNLITSAIEINNGVAVGSVSVSGHYRLETGTSYWYIDSGTIVGYFATFDFIEPLFVDPT